MGEGYGRGSEIRLCSLRRGELDGDGEDCEL